MTDPPYPVIRVIVNPASGRDEPVLNVLNDVFTEHDVEWDVRVTHRFGDAAALTRAAIGDGVDLIAGYGGDGTQHEVAGAIVSVARAGGRRVPLGILPGGTGNGFSREVGTPRELAAAVRLLCTSRRTRAVDVGRVRIGSGDTAREELFIQRLYLGMDPEQQTSRKEKDRYGVLAYPISMLQRHDADRQHRYRVVLDGEALEMSGSRLYVVNSGMTGSGLRILSDYAIDDGLLDCFVLDRETLQTMASAGARFLDLHSDAASRYYRTCRTISVDAEPGQTVWADGEHVGRTPVAVDVLPGALDVVVPDAAPQLGVFHRSFDRLYPAIRFTYEKLLRQEWFTQVTPELWLGGAPTERRDHQQVLALGIGAVVDMRAERDAPEGFYRKHGIPFRQYRVPDTSVPGPEILTDAVAWIGERVDEGRTVLIHCAKGRGRSATVLAAYLMAREGSTFEEADALLRRRRPLVKLQQRHREALEAWIADRRVT